MTPIFCKARLIGSRRPHVSAWTICALATLLFVAAPVGAADYVAYPGIYPARLKTVETPARFVFEIPVWTGFTRVFTITLPGVAVPRNTGGAPACERELANRAKRFSESFLTQALRVEVHDIAMQDSSDTNAKAPVFTNAGSLADALRKGGFARSSDVASDTPWCDSK